MSCVKVTNLNVSIPPTPNLTNLEKNDEVDDCLTLFLLQQELKQCSPQTKIFKPQADIKSN